ncbi:hypothetical protein FA95DRAFT_1455223, partial [Auriscalpium vulgare]
RTHTHRPPRHSSRATTTLAPPTTQLMGSGAYKVRLISCQSCGMYLGFEFARASEPSERWKEGLALLEL